MVTSVCIVSCAKWFIWTCLIFLTHGLGTLFIPILQGTALNLTWSRSYHVNWWSHDGNSGLPGFIDFRPSILHSHLQSFHWIKTILLMRRIFSSILLPVGFVLLSCHKTASGHRNWELGVVCGSRVSLLRGLGRKILLSSGVPLGVEVWIRGETEHSEAGCIIREKNVELINEQVNKLMNEEMNELFGGVTACKGRGTILLHPGRVLIQAVMRGEKSPKLLVPSLVFLQLHWGITDKENCIYLRYITWWSDICVHIHHLT